MSPEQQTGGGGTGAGGRRAFLVAGTEQAPVRCAVHGQQGQAPGAQVIVVEKAGPGGMSADGSPVTGTEAPMKEPGQ